MKRRGWKKVEERVSRKLGGKRTPLSGSMSGHTSGDTIFDSDDKRYVEIRTRKNMTVFSMFREVKKRAKKEGKTPVLVLHETGKHSYLKVEEIDGGQSNDG